MLTKIEVTTDHGTMLALSLDNPSGGIEIRDVEGLDPVEASLVSSSFAQMDGEQYQSSRSEKRNLIFKLGMELASASGTVRDIRNRLYGIFMPKSEVHIRFYMEGELPLDIYGRVESFKAPLFVQDPEATISLLCYESDFFSPEPTIIDGLTTSGSDEFVIDYEGSSPTGIVFRMNVDRDISDFTIHHRPANDTISSLMFSAPLLAGDTLEISTVSGSKGASLDRLGGGGSILYGISPYSDWINIFTGQNNFRVYAEGLPIPFTIEYHNKFGGL